MSVADTHRVIALEATVAALLSRLAALEEMVADTRARCAACQGGEASAGTTPGPLLVPSTPRPSSDPAMADVIAALQAGQSIRGAAKVLGIDRSKVDRLRQRAIAEGTMSRSDLRRDRALRP